MKAAILKGYDKNGCDLALKEIPIPENSDQEVLVKIHTAGVNPLDNMIIHGEVKMIVRSEQVSAGILSVTGYMAECLLPRLEHLLSMRQSTRTQSRRSRNTCLTRK